MYRFRPSVAFLLLGTSLGMALLFLHQYQFAGLVWSAMMVGAAIRTASNENWRPFSFSYWVIGVVLLAMSTPALFLQWGPIDSVKALTPLIQIIMFGMGATLSFQDFQRVLAEPRKIAVGMILQFTVMPLTGWLLAWMFALPPGIAAGVILIGSCPGGVASNVITYLARGNVALSVTMTACSTLLSPIMTPLCMKLLAGSYIEVSFLDMLFDIIKIVIVPVIGGLVFHYVLELLQWHSQRVDQFLSLGAMVAICIVIGVIVAKSRDKLLIIGPTIFAIAVLHNAIGYALGYWGGKWFGMNKTDCRTVSIEVGMQNGGMASALATNVLNIPDAAIAGTIFGPWMSIAGASLASWWRRQDQRKSHPESSFTD